MNHKSSRTKKTAINTVTGLICTMFSCILSMVLRALFIRLLGLEYSGVNSLFVDIIKILNLTEVGIRNAILFKLYKCIANDDHEGVEKYLTAYRRICVFIACLIGIGGLAFTPFLNFFVKKTPSFPEPLWSLYLLVLVSCIISHLIDFTNIIIIAKQDRYIAILIQYLGIFLLHGLQIFILITIKNIYLYLSASIVTNVIMGLVAGLVSKNKYGYSWNSPQRLSLHEKKEISKDIGALAVFKFCRTINVTIATFLISKFISVSTTAIYGSVTVITMAINNLLSTLNDGMIASVGDLYASGKTKQVEKVIDISMHLVFLLYGSCTVVLTSFLSPFMHWWIGYSLPNSCIYILLFNFYVAGQNAAIATFRNAMGLYRKGWKRPAATCVVNVLVSLVLIQKMGIIGAFIGTTIATFTTIVWYDPYVIYNYGLGISPIGYFFRYIVYLSVVFISSIIILFLHQRLPNAIDFYSLFGHGMLYMSLGLTLLIMIGYFFPAQKELISRIKQIILAKRITI